LQTFVEFEVLHCVVTEFADASFVFCALFLWGDVDQHILAMGNTLIVYVWKPK